MILEGQGHRRAILWRHQLQKRSASEVDGGGVRVISKHIVRKNVGQRTSAARGNALRRHCEELSRPNGRIKDDSVTTELPV